MMRWDNCYSDRRTGRQSQSISPRTEYQRDFDRLIFASAFRRLQNKTQVFPLPGSTFVHNRLTHSLEVASVGRSLGAIIGKHICSAKLDPRDDDSQQFYRHDLSSVIAAACLAHDIGNPAFGHSGEKAISHYFLDRENQIINGTPLRQYFSKRQWSDLSNFEGNANAIRILTHSYRDKPESGMGLTYTTLAAILKYPCSSSMVNRKYKHRKKYGFLIPETATVQSIASELHMNEEEPSGQCYARHPFVYLVEAADDICYRIIDLEDAHRLGIVSKERASKALMNVLDDLQKFTDSYKKIKTTFEKINDDNDSIAYLRAKTISALTEAAAFAFIDHEEAILAGIWNNTLLDHVESNASGLKHIADLSMTEIYNHHSVIEIEITGFHVMSHLLSLFVPAVLAKHPSGRDRMALNLIPNQFREYEITDNPYVKVLSVVDFISGMTDAYATEFYRKTTGIDISKHV
ncbi:MAG: dGTP triphosphohydrolase [Bacteroidota bacterium]